MATMSTQERNFLAIHYRKIAMILDSDFKRDAFVEVARMIDVNTDALAKATMALIERQTIGKLTLGASEMMIIDKIINLNKNLQTAFFNLFNIQSIEKIDTGFIVNKKPPRE